MRLHIVPHTHWDREWYLPLEALRVRLIEVMDQVLELVATSYHHFHLDGQVAMVEDYLEVRPERRAELRAAVARGALSCGPWVTLVDGFSVSGEAIVRNLEEGLERAARLGGALMVGYLPDQFGHIGQMPQILRMFGIERALVWRGVPGCVTGTTFTWRAPDGSEVLAAYLPYGYGQGARLPGEPDAFRARLAREAARLASFASPGAALLMAGDDHEAPQAALPDLVASAAPDARLSSLEAYFAEAPPPCTAVTGELRSAARANLLPNTYSARFTQKVERARAEALLERYAEPLCALVEGCSDHSAVLGAAWQLLHLNGAHDSVCGCSADEVAQAVDRRTRAAARRARSVIDDALDRLGRRVARAGHLAFNPCLQEVRGIPPLGWLVAGHPPARPAACALAADGRALVVGSGEEAFRLAFEDQNDAGDLYSFCPGGPARPPEALEVAGGRALVSFEGSALELRAERGAGEPFVRLDVVVHNHRPDHRLRLLCEIGGDAGGSVALAPFELVARPPAGEGGPGEPGSPWWPAQGGVWAGGLALLAEGVFEYEVGDRTLAATLLRATGTISRQAELATRAAPAGPGVATPGAQMLGSYRRAFGVLAGAGPADLPAAAERFALAPALRRAPGGGPLPASGRLLDLEAPALSALRRRGGRIEARVYNPAARPAAARLGAEVVVLPPFAIRTLTAP